MCPVGGALESQDIFLLHQIKINISPTWTGFGAGQNPQLQP